MWVCVHVFHSIQFGLYCSSLLFNLVCVCVCVCVCVYVFPFNKIWLYCFNPNNNNNSIPESKVTTYPCHRVGAVTVLSSDILCVSCADDKLRVYEVYGTELRLLVTWPVQLWNFGLVGCLYHAGYVIASLGPLTSKYGPYVRKYVRISVASRFNHDWVLEVTKIMFNSSILPFCRDVCKIILKYL